MIGTAMTVVISVGDASIVRAAAILDCGTLVIDSSPNDSNRERSGPGDWSETFIAPSTTLRFVAVGGGGRSGGKVTRVIARDGRGAIVEGLLTATVGQEFTIAGLSASNSSAMSAEINDNMGARLVVAGSGGRVGYANSDEASLVYTGGDAGTPAPGANGAGPHAGAGATQSSGGAGGVGPGGSGESGDTAGVGVGGIASDFYTNHGNYIEIYGGDGGSGYHGGGGAGAGDESDPTGGGGGGGSSFADPTLTSDVTYELDDLRSGPRVIVYACTPPPAMPLTTPAGYTCGSPTIFNLTSEIDRFTVPAGQTVAIIDAYGASGGSLAFSSMGQILGVAGISAEDLVALGGSGGRASTIVPVAPGAILDVRVGGNGSQTLNGDELAGGFNGGGSASNYSSGALTSGGGASDVRPAGGDITSSYVVAGGGGGAGRLGSGGEIFDRPTLNFAGPSADGFDDVFDGGSAGFPAGANGTGILPGTGGDQAVGGSSGAIPSGSFNPAGAGFGGSVEGESGYRGSLAGGGGGWFGGGSSGSLIDYEAQVFDSSASSGGGGSSYAVTSSGFSAPVFENGVRQGAGLVQIVTCALTPIETITTNIATTTTTIDPATTTTTTAAAVIAAAPTSTIDFGSGAGLPATGSDATSSAWLGAAALLAGAVLVGVTRRRRTS